MNRMQSTLLAVLAAIPVIAQAHTHLKSATPADGSTVAASPPSIMLMFSEATRVTALTLQTGNEKNEQKLGPLPETASEHVMVSVPKLAPGAYTVHWRALGADNHVMSGALKFTVSADGTASTPKMKDTHDAGMHDEAPKAGSSPEHEPHSH